MKHLRKFEDLDHLDFLAAEKDLRDRKDNSHIDKLNKLSASTAGKHLPKLASDKAGRESSDVMVADRKQIVDRVIEGLRNDSMNNPGYQSFKDELLAFLDEFPKE